MVMMVMIIAIDSECSWLVCESHLIYTKSTREDNAQD